MGILPKKMFEFDEDVYEINIEELERDDYELKFFVWSRKIEDQVYWLEENKSELAVKDYLEKCADLREKFLDPDDLTEIEEYYMEKIQPIWKKYGIQDPLWKE